VGSTCCFFRHDSHEVTTASIFFPLAFNLGFGEIFLLLQLLLIKKKALILVIVRHLVSFLHLPFSFFEAVFALAIALGLSGREEGFGLLEVVMYIYQAAVSADETI